VWLAGLGAVALACDTANETFSRLIDRGQQVKAGVQDRAEDVRRQNAGARDRVDEYVRSGMDVLLSKLNFPSKGDVDTINVKLNMLARKMDDLQMRAAMQSQAGVPPQSESAAPEESSG
jgi:polyhydroxyalkanoate synthesis regulator phasin